MSAQDQDTQRLGQQIGSYQLIDFLGKGGFADVYLGEHIYLHTQNAIKILRVQLSEDSLQDFLTEAQTIARLEHPHIVHVFDYGVQGDTPFLVMSYAPNGTLRTRYPHHTRLPLEHVVPLVVSTVAKICRQTWTQAVFAAWMPYGLPAILQHSSRSKNPVMSERGWCLNRPPVGPTRAPPLFRVCSFAYGPGLDHRGCPPQSSPA